MIFVTVGTHEQSFQRLIKEIDILVGSGKINQEVFIQKGYTEYEVKNCKNEKLLDYDTMMMLFKKANIIITHGGPATIMQAWQESKIPIVVPRNPVFREHVDNHQIEFVKKLESEGKVIAVYEIDKLLDAIASYSSNQSIKYNKSDEFINKLEKIIVNIFEGE